MTLSKQLYILILFISSLMAVGTLYISIENTRSYLMLQLATQTQNSADSLGLSLVPHLKNNDIAAIDTMANVVFDSGYYKSLTLKTMTGETLINRENTNQIEGVPHQFIQMLELDTPSAESIIMSGWNQAGTLTLVAHPGFAYKKMWDASMEIFWWSLLVLLLSFAAASIILRFILKPLNTVEAQAEKICEREFPINHDIPKTRELKRIVLAMNKMSAKVESIISKLTERAEKARHQTFNDELTGLMNREQFFSVTQHTFKDTEQAGSGYIAIIRLQRFADYNNQYGHQAGDTLLQEIAQLLLRISQTFHEPTVARISGVDFAVLLPLTTSEGAHTCGEALTQAIYSMKTSSNNFIHAGIAPFDSKSNIGEVLSDADTALASAQHHGSKVYAIQDHKSEALGNAAWKTLIIDVLKQKAIHFLSQPIVSSQGNTLYHEVLMRVKDNQGNSVSPASFTAMAERMGQHLALDQYIIHQILETLQKQTDQKTKYAVNISAQNLSNTNFTFWLHEQMLSHQDVAANLCFEITEYGAAQNIEASQHFIDLVHQYKGQVTLEHFGTRTDSFHTLRQLKVDYIKLDGSYLTHIKQNQEQLTFLQSVIDIAHSLDIQLITEHMEDEHEVAFFKSIGIDAMQGYYFGKPSPI
ncbi:MAG: EAL domain-containing protein [Ghiorsea sp.]